MKTLSKTPAKKGIHCNITNHLIFNKLLLADAAKFNYKDIFMDLWLNVLTHLFEFESAWTV